jgi:hypothetical protein
MNSSFVWVLAYDWVGYLTFWWLSYRHFSSVKQGRVGIQQVIKCKVLRIVLVQRLLPRCECYSESSPRGWGWMLSDLYRSWITLNSPAWERALSYEVIQFSLPDLPLQRVTSKIPWTSAPTWQSRKRARFSWAGKWCMSLLYPRVIG